MYHCETKKLFHALMVVVLLGTITCTERVASAQNTSATASNILSRRYTAGEVVRYKMSGRNQDNNGLRIYTASASGTVTRNSSGTFVVPFSWSSLVWNGAKVLLPPSDMAMKETLSLDTGFKLTVPNLSGVNPKLIGPITDLLTFYADLQLADRQKDLRKAGDHVFFKHDVPNSWADGQVVLLGQDAIDFDITLEAIDPTKKIATVLVRHVPPDEERVKLPSEWMRKPVGDRPNNFVQVIRQGADDFDVKVGQETFDVELKVSTEDGELLAAHMENPVKGIERHCKNAELTVCSESTPFTVLRQISIE